MLKKSFFHIVPVTSFLPMTSRNSPLPRIGEVNTSSVFKISTQSACNCTSETEQIGSRIGWCERAPFTCIQCDRSYVSCIGFVQISSYMMHKRADVYEPKA